ncbi:MAG: cytochrome c [Alphaproteobacteria bacterium]|nr:cytochrome c [Alphaproteobacteria bacterium]
MIAGVAALGLIGSAGLVSGHGGATGIVKERMDLMVSVGKAMKTITDMIQGETEFDAETLRESANFIAAHGGEQMSRLFPEDSIEGPSEALPAIWQDWERFSALAEDLRVFAGALAQAADNPRGGNMHGNRGNSPIGMSSGDSPMTRGNPMMGSNPMMGGNRMMGGGQSPMDDPDALANMPPEAAFARVAQTCSACHTEFRKKQ